MKTNLYISMFIANKLSLPRVINNAEILEERKKSIKISYKNNSYFIPRSQIIASGANTIYYDRR